MAVLGIVVGYFAMVAVFPIGLSVLISSPSASATEASTKSSSVVAAIAVCIHCCTEVAVGIADVLCNRCSGCLLLDGGNNVFN